MALIDKSAFLDHKKLLTIDLIGGNSISLAIALNFPVGVYYKVICLLDNLNKQNNIINQVESSADAVSAILQTADKAYSLKWVLENISVENQFNILSSLMGEIQKLIDAEYLKIPNIEVKPTISFESKDAKKRREKQENIKRLRDLLDGKRQMQLMGDIALVMIKTNNSYKDVLDMPILFFRDLVKTIIVNESRADDDYELAYLKWECEQYKIAIGNGEADEKPAKPKGADVKKFHQLFG